MQTNLPSDSSEFVYFAYSLLAFAAVMLTVILAFLRILIWAFPGLKQYRTLEVLDDSLEKPIHKKEIAGTTMVLLYKLIQNFRPELLEKLVTFGQNLIKNDIHDIKTFGFMVNKNDNLKDLAFSIQDAQVETGDLLAQLEKLNSQQK